MNKTTNPGKNITTFIGDGEFFSVLHWFGPSLLLKNLIQLLVNIAGLFTFLSRTEFMGFQSNVPSAAKWVEKMGEAIVKYQDQVFHPIIIIGDRVDEKLLEEVIKQDIRLFLIWPEKCFRRVWC